MTTRQHILEEIYNALTTITDIKYLEIERSTPLEIDSIPFPAVFIYSGPEMRVEDNRGVIGYETYEWNISIECWGTNVDMEDLLGQIHTVMFINNEFHDYACYSYRMGVSHLVVDPDQSLRAMILEYVVLYRHVQGVP
jgi:hypothetical protein